MLYHPIFFAAVKSRKEVSRDFVFIWRLGFCSLNSQPLCMSSDMEKARKPRFKLMLLLYFWEQNHTQQQQGAWNVLKAKPTGHKQEQNLVNTRQNITTAVNDEGMSCWFMSVRSSTMVTLCAVLTGSWKIQHSLAKIHSTDQPIFTAINHLLTAKTRE